MKKNDRKVSIYLAPTFKKISKINIKTLVEWVDFLFYLGRVRFFKP